MSLSANVARDADVAVRSEFNGTVTEVHVVDGAEVTAGQLLFSVREDEWPRRTFEIVAPEAGEVSQIALVKGQMVGIGGETLTLTPNRYHVLAIVQPVQLYRLVDAPTDATVTITGGPAAFTCTGVGVEVTADGNASVRCAVPNDQVVFAGLPATLDIALGEVENALVIPVTAVKGGSGSGVVWVDAGDGETEERSVTLGVNDGTTVEVLGGLDEGETIRMYVPGFAAPIEQFCWDDGMGGEYCETGTSW